MAKGLVGNVYKAGEVDYIVLEELNYKNILCVYAMMVMENEEEGEKRFFQVDSTGMEISLVDINSSKMINALVELMKKTEEDKHPRRINENESIPDYLAYLDDFYRSKVGASV